MVQAMIDLEILVCENLQFTRNGYQVGFWSCLNDYILMSMLLTVTCPTGPVIITIRWCLVISTMWTYLSNYVWNVMYLVTVVFSCRGCKTKTGKTPTVFKGWISVCNLNSWILDCNLKRFQRSNWLTPA